MAFLSIYLHLTIMFVDARRRAGVTVPVHAWQYLSTAVYFLLPFALYSVFCLDWVANRYVHAPSYLLAKCGKGCCPQYLKLPSHGATKTRNARWNVILEIVLTLHNIRTCKVHFLNRGKFSRQQTNKQLDIQPITPLKRQAAAYWWYCGDKQQRKDGDVEGRRASVC